MNTNDLLCDTGVALRLLALRCLVVAVYVAIILVVATRRFESIPYFLNLLWRAL